ncbi:MAG: pyruvate, water dikinase regulatory protein [Bacillota bacterium]|nr:pyruvate, water dikinase regulatory protein [Bacillota bacterium]
MSKYNVYVLSDSVGETAESVAKATITQFKDLDVSIQKYSNIETPSAIEKIFSSMDHANSMVIFTIVLQPLKEYLIQACEQYGVKFVDVMGETLTMLSEITGAQPHNEPGVMRQLNEEYFKRIQAVEFAVKYDDGKDPRGVLLADCVLIGISRTSKTPLSMYLAHKNLKVANIPLVPEIPVPKELYEVNPSKIFCLTNDKNVLNKIRRERLKEMGLSADADYASVDRIDEELRFAKELAAKLNCKIINVADKAIEESSNIILRALKPNNR